MLTREQAKLDANPAHMQYCLRRATRMSCATTRTEGSERMRTNSLPRLALTLSTFPYPPIALPRPLWEALLVAPNSSLA
jgi:hypothetical protein